MNTASQEGGIIPLLGKAELSWVKATLPPVKLPEKPSPTKNEPAEDTRMDEGDTVPASPTIAELVFEGAQQQQDNLDYDVADDNEWGLQ